MGLRLLALRLLLHLSVLLLKFTLWHWRDHVIAPVCLYSSGGNETSRASDVMHLRSAVIAITIWYGLAGQPASAVIGVGGMNSGPYNSFSDGGSARAPR
jgi:hypothetical protein